MDNANRPHVSLTVFSTAKAFRGITAIQQHNAIQSWRRLGPEVEVLLIGDDAGTAEAAREYGTRHVSAVKRNAYGTPLISSIFEQAATLASSPLLCYVNADIMLMSDFMTAIHRVQTDRFLLCGQRYDLDLTEPIDFAGQSWEAELRQRTRHNGVLHGVTGMDYFVFPRTLFKAMPEFAIGRALWDNWMVFYARAQRIPVVDATRAVVVVHQNHDYAHLAGGVQAAWAGPEATNNRVLAADMLYPFTIADADWQLTERGLARNLSVHRFTRLLQGRVAVGLKAAPTARRLIRWALRAAG